MYLARCIGSQHRMLSAASGGSRTACPMCSGPGASAGWGRSKLDWVRWTVGGALPTGLGCLRIFDQHRARRVRAAPCGARGAAEQRPSIAQATPQQRPSSARSDCSRAVAGPDQALDGAGQEAHPPIPPARERTLFVPVSMTPHLSMLAPGADARRARGGCGRAAARTRGRLGHDPGEVHRVPQRRCARESGSPAPDARAPRALGAAVRVRHRLCASGIWRWTGGVPVGARGVVGLHVCGARAWC